MSQIYISNIAFEGPEAERAHFAEMHGRLQTLTAIFGHLDLALDSLLVMHASLGMQVEELRTYLSKLSPGIEPAVPTPERLPQPSVEGRRGSLKVWFTKIALDKEIQILRDVLVKTREVLQRHPACHVDVAAVEDIPTVVLGNMDVDVVVEPEAE
ncbi:hypothetical protein TRAPUB_6901 [Trametes pubescens]|uniref:Uncharacterized protein n=1 Tax=Trametes pubescens TaxID=154538 RepID=A0A1M2V4P0_TRAPU|nr:hypothetical protein TRAPUB_6901 [Trametes pubescens]